MLIEILSYTPSEINLIVLGFIMCVIAVVTLDFFGLMPKVDMLPSQANIQGLRDQMEADIFTAMQEKATK